MRLLRQHDLFLIPVSLKKVGVEWVCLRGDLPQANCVVLAAAARSDAPAFYGEGEGHGLRPDLDRRREEEGWAGEVRTYCLLRRTVTRGRSPTIHFRAFGTAHLDKLEKMHKQSVKNHNTRGHLPSSSVGEGDE